MTPTKPPQNTNQLQELRQIVLKVQSMFRKTHSKSGDIIWVPMGYLSEEEMSQFRTFLARTAPIQDREEF